MITIKEIARELGVSPTTVSNVVNGHTDKMSMVTRQKIEEALVRYDFNTAYPDKNYSKALKLVSVDFFIRYKDKVFTDPFCAELLDAIGERLQKYGRYQVCSAPKNIDDIYDKFQASNIEGGIVIGFNPSECEMFAKKVGKPIVFIDCGEGNYDNVGNDDYAGAKEITEFMLKQGHRRIAFFCDRKEPITNSFERFRGYCDALKGFGIAYSNQDYFYLPNEKHQRREILRSFAMHAKKDGYTAAFIISDLLASEAINVFFAEGLRVPEDISVSGFDDNIYARLCRPMLTTVRQPIAEKGIEAVDLLMRRIKKEEVEARSFKLPVELIVRDSVLNINGEIR